LINKNLKQKNNTLLFISLAAAVGYCAIVYFAFILNQPHDQAILVWIFTAMYGAAAGVNSIYRVAFAQKNYAEIFFVTSMLLNFVVTICALNWAEKIAKSLPFNIIIWMLIPCFLFTIQVFIFVKYSRREWVAKTA